MCTHNLVLLTRQDQFDKTSCLVFGLGAVNISPGKLDDAYLLVLFLSIMGRETHTSNFGISEGTPRHYAIIDLFLGDRQQGITCRDTCLIGRDMGKEVTTDHIANGQDIRCGTVEILIYMDAFAIVFDASVLQIESIYIWLASHG